MQQLAKSHQRKIYLTLFFAAVAFLYTLPIFRNLNHWGIQDWDLHLFYNGVPRVTLLEYGQFPLWNPYFLGGTAMLAHPESQFLTPSFLLVLLFGEVVGLKLALWLHLVIGLGGGYALGRYYKMERLPAMMTAFVFTLNSMFALAFTVGMTWFMPVAYLPWAFLFYLKGFSDWRYGLVSGFFLTLMFFSGAAYPLPITLLFFGLYGLILVVFKEYTFLKLTRLLVIIVIFTLCLGAIKFFPSIEFQRTYPRTLYDYSGYSLNSLRYSLFSRDQTLAAIENLPVEQPGFLNGVTAGMDENGIYIGLIPFALFIIGIGLHDKRRLVLFLCFLILLWIGLGSRPRAELWSLLHLVPFYKAMRIAQRFRIVFMLCLAILAGFGLQTMKQYLLQVMPQPRWAWLSTLAVLLLVLTDLVAVSWPVFNDAFSIPPLTVEKNDTFYQIADLPAYDKNGWVTSEAATRDDPFEEYNRFHMFSSYGSVYPAFLANLGTINVVTSAAVPREAIPTSAENYQGEVYLKDTTGALRISRWSPNAITMHLEVEQPGFVVVNQNYYSGWRVVGGQARQVEPVEKYLGVKVFPEDKEIQLYYRPTSFVLGLAVSLTTVALALIYTLRLLLTRSLTQPRAKGRQLTNIPLISKL